jgi:hypothetical protein
MFLATALDVSHESKSFWCVGDELLNRVNFARMKTASETKPIAERDRQTRALGRI